MPNPAEPRISREAAEEWAAATATRIAAALDAYDPDGGIEFTPWLIGFTVLSEIADGEESLLALGTPA